MAQDYIYSLFSIAFIAFYMGFNIGSIVLTLAGLFEIILSFPIALFFWRKIMQQNNIDFLTFVGFFLILCIGADDIFVFMDTWKASKTAPARISGTFETRFAWTWRTAASTMLTTTLTTAVCLACTAASPIPAVKAFGIVGSLLVVADYIMVITWFPACVLLYARSCGACASCEAKFCCTAPKGQPCCAGGCCCCGPSGPSPAAHAAEGSAPPKERTATWFLRERAAPKLYQARYVLVLIAIGCFGGALYKYQTMEKARKIPLFKESHPVERKIDIEAKHFVDSGVEHIRVQMLYGVDQTSPYKFPQQHQILPDAYRREGFGEVVFRAFDLDGATQVAVADDCQAAHDATGNDRIVDSETGSALVALPGCYCILNELKEWVLGAATPDAAAQGGAWPLATEAQLITAFQAFVSEEDKWNETAAEEVRRARRATWGLANGYVNVTQDFCEHGGVRWEDTVCGAWERLDYDGDKRAADQAAESAAKTKSRVTVLEAMDGYHRRSAFIFNDAGDDIIGYYTTFNSTIPMAAIKGQLFGGDVTILQPNYDKWERFEKANCKDEPCVFYSGYFRFMKLLTDLNDFALSTIGICLGASFIVLLFTTMNAVIALLSTVAVTMNIFCVVALTIFAGFKSGMYESIFTILVVGMAIDYAVHLAHFYNHAKGTRYERAQTALDGVGISVIGGAITTIGAGVPMCLTVVVFFNTLGWFILLVAITSIVLSFIFLLPALMIIGPEGTQGDLGFLLPAKLKSAEASPRPAPPAKAGFSAEV